MPQHLRLAELGESGEVFAAKLRAQQLGATPIAGGARRQIGTAAAFGRKLENQRHAGNRLDPLGSRSSLNQRDRTNSTRTRHYRTPVFAIAAASGPNSSPRFISVTDIRSASESSG